MTINVTARFVDISENDDEGTSSIYIKWGAIGEYIDVAREMDSVRVYCEIFDQKNGFELESLRFTYSNNILVLEVTPPETFIRNGQEQRVEINFTEIDFDENHLAQCLLEIFNKN